ncbi:alkaline phosphatase D family protein [Asticcacaulis sp. BYS171W]|uniref:Alkaline phosphatase D family protein n=1 Tax=Asticcacaulis aquaticus TaxID=2984212 RepID=A0ABT5HRU1_9CAUL|nr:alkaline phosphatase D family protein [Asticcacaulis aquaticus]MDC7682783.1 alkaline phosphatase D family protein [Asticcacaulis aquaticus]
MTLFRRQLLTSALAVLAGVTALPRKVLGAVSQKGIYRLMQGPMLGAVGPDRVRLHMRCSACATLTVEYATNPDFSGSKVSAGVATGPDTDYIALIELTGLTPATRYAYRILIDGQPDGYQKRLAPFHFTTAPVVGQRQPFTVAFGSCARIQAAEVQPIWDAIAAQDPDLFLWLGDNVYHDTLEPQIMDEMWRWQRSVPNLEPILRTVPQLAIWDDHDYGLNDHDRTNPVKDIALASFKKYWANPSYGLPDAPGVFFAFSYGDVDFFMLDSRYHRDPNEAPDTPQKTLLGARQLQWLKDGLKKSRASFKIIACGSGWSNAKGPGGDSWAAFLNERDALFDFIRDAKIEGVVLLSGDTHVGELNAIPASEKGGYDLYDLVSSPLAQDPELANASRKPEKRIRPAYVSDVNFGSLRFDFDPEPRLTFVLRNSRGQAAWAPFILRASDLRNGVSTWAEKSKAPA